MPYIEWEKFLEMAKDEYYSDFHKSMADLTSLRELLEDTPAADVVEVVRCKDCKYREKMTDKYIWCAKHKVFMEMKSDDDYCSKGERKDGE